MTQTNKDRVIEEFQRRRKNMLQKFAFCIILVAFALAMKQLAELTPEFLGMSNEFWSAVAIALLIVGIVLGAAGIWQYRCPVCEEIIRGHERDFPGAFLHPRNCPRCGAPLS